MAHNRFRAKAQEAPAGYYQNDCSELNETQRPQARGIALFKEDVLLVEIVGRKIDDQTVRHADKNPTRKHIDIE